MQLPKFSWKLESNSYSSFHKFVINKILLKTQNIKKLNKTEEFIG